ncbi:MAG: hypothetical protein K8L99_24475, partial [Anaerolineae bacterium]|nr:hypothetical protein [Anaerolineae bacterium]
DAEEEVIPGVSRRQLLTIAGIGGGVIVLLLLIVAAIVVISNSNRNAEIAVQTREALSLTGTQTAFDSQQTATVAARIALEGTPTPTPLALATLPPTFTPTPTEAPEIGEVALPTPPPSVGGTLAGWGGRDVLGNGALEIFILPLVGSYERSQVGTEYGMDVRFADSNQRVIYTRYFAPTFSFGVEAVNINGTQPLVFQDNQAAYQLSEPDRCPINNQITFAGLPQREVSVENIEAGDPPRQIFVADRDTGERRVVTSDTATYSDPTFSPDCTKIAAVRDDQNSINIGPDVVIIDVASGSFFPITTDFSSFAEKTPRWSPDGQQIVFAAAPVTEPANNDLVIVNADGTGAPLLLARSPVDDILPVFSPDGQYLAFSSNRSGLYNIYIYEPASSELWQVTDSANEGDFFVGDWWQ